MGKLPWMKLYVGEVSLSLEGLPLDACGAYLRLIILTWDRGPIRKTTAEAILQRPLDSFGEAFMDLLKLSEDRVSVDAVEAEKGLREGKSKQTASAANLRWQRERMRTHSETHSERSAPRNAIKKEKQNKEAEAEGEKKAVPAPAPFEFIWPTWAGPQTLSKWEEFKAYRWEDHKAKYKSGNSEQRAINLLAKYYDSGEKCFNDLDKAMGRGWLFPVDPKEQEAKLAAFTNPKDDE